jgi:hypothetical protein
VNGVNFGTIFWIIVILLFVIGRALKSAKDATGRQGEAVPDDEGFQATPDEIQDFLRSLNAAAQRRGAGVNVAPEVGERARLTPPQATQPAFWEGVAPVQPMPVVETPRPQRPRRAQAPRKAPARRKAPPREVLVATPPAAPAPQKQQGTAAHRLALRGTDLRRAVVWSEVLGPPVSCRRARRLPLGPQQ